MPLLWLSLSFLVGIGVADVAAWSIITWLSLSGLILAVWLLGRSLKPAIQRLDFSAIWTALRRATSGLPQSLQKILAAATGLRPSLPLPVLLAVVCLGAARYQAALPDLTDPGLILQFNDQGSLYEVIGIIVDAPDERDTYTNLRIRVEHLQPVGAETNAEAHGDLLARVPTAGDWRYGDRLRLRGYLITPPETEEFSYREYLNRQDIFSLMEFPEAELLERGLGDGWRAALFDLRGRLLAIVYRLYPDPEASLMAGILLGVETGIPRDVAQAFRDTGTAHIIAISGFNISILAGLFMKLFSRMLGRWRGALVAALVIAFYTLLVGAGASVVRAAIMGGLGLFARQVGRRQDGLVSLAFTAAVMALINPYILLDVGFQLSFAATLGLVLYGGPSQAAVASVAGRALPPASAQRMASLVGEYFLFTLAAQLTTLPVIIYHFGRVSLSALLANPLILPAQPAVMVLGGIGVLLGAFFLPGGQVVAYMAWPFVAYTIRMVEALSRIPGDGLVLWNVSLSWVMAFYLVLFGGTFVFNRLGPMDWRRLVSKVRPSLIVFGLMVSTVLVWRMAWSAPDGRLHLTVLEASTDSSSGEALLIQTPGGRYLLAGGGPSTSALSDALGRRLPPGRRRLDMLIVADPGEEQTAALPRLLERFPSEQVLWAGPTHASPSARALQAVLSEAGIVPISAQSGQMLDLGDGAVLRVLSANLRGVVLLLEWGGFSALLPFGMDVDALDTLQNDPAIGPLSALLLAESGYAPLNPPEWIERLRPGVVLLSVAPGDREGRPSPETLDAMQGYTLLRTDRNGWIELTTDGENLWVEVEKE